MVNASPSAQSGVADFMQKLHNSCGYGQKAHLPRQELLQNRRKRVIL